MRPLNSSQSCTFFWTTCATLTCGGGGIPCWPPPLQADKIAALKSETAKPIIIFLLRIRRPKDQKRIPALAGVVIFHYGKTGICRPRDGFFYARHFPGQMLSALHIHCAHSLASASRRAMTFFRIASGTLWQRVMSCQNKPAAANSRIIKLTSFGVPFCPS